MPSLEEFDPRGKVAEGTDNAKMDAMAFILRVFIVELGFECFQSKLGKCSHYPHITDL